jgi:hypothetical protein
VFGVGGDKGYFVVHCAVKKGTTYGIMSICIHALSGREQSEQEGKREIKKLKFIFILIFKFLIMIIIME